MADLGRLVIQLVKDLSHARRERDLAIKLVVIAGHYIGQLKRNDRLDQERDRAMALIDTDRDRDKQEPITPISEDTRTI